MVFLYRPLPHLKQSHKVRKDAVIDQNPIEMDDDENQVNGAHD
jgi:hypothetical protein